MKELLLSALLLFGYGSQLQVSTLLLPFTYSTELRVIDGDTFIWHDERIRIANIDAPELHGACNAERELARKAWQRLEELLNPETFRLQKLARRDRYGRTLAFVHDGNGDIGRQLVKEGLARPWKGKRAPWCA